MKKEEKRWCMGWQSPTGTPIEDVLKGAIEHFMKKYFCLPEVIFVNDDVNLKSWGNIQVRRDASIYCRGIVHLLIPSSVEIQK